MNLSQQTLIDLLEDKAPNSLEPNFYSLKEEDAGYLSPVQMASLYTNSALLVTIMIYLKEQLWLKNKEDKKTGIETSYVDFISPMFLKELSEVRFLKDFLVRSGPAGFRKVSKDAQLIEEKVIALMIDRSSEDQKEFVTQSLKLMSSHFIHEEKLQEGELQSDGHVGMRLYRTFDNLDDIFDLNYQLDKDMIVDKSAKERLYAGSGVGVQSGYSTILLALNEIAPKLGSRIIDLGSGYGRVGLVCSLLRPDIDFIGYEYVNHRVVISNNASKFLGLEDSLHFETQDLSLESFKIPEADVYYLYDPFTKETYKYILEQIVKVSKRMKVTIVTKGNARNWLLDIADENCWPSPVFIDEGNLCVFRSF